MEIKDRLKLVGVNKKISTEKIQQLEVKDNSDVKESIVSYDVVMLLLEALEHAEKGNLISVSLVAVHSDNKVSTESAGDIKKNIIALNGGIVKQLFSLNLSSILS